MSTNKSQNLNLHLWVPEDNFLRSEFNENFTALDEEVVRRDRDMMDILSYHIHRLMAKRDFDLNYQGPHRNMFINTFRSLSQRANISNLHWDGTSALMLGPQAQMTADQFIALLPRERNSGDSKYNALNSPTFVEFTMNDVPARLTSIKVYAMINDTTLTDTINISCTASLYRIEGKGKILAKQIPGLSLTYDCRNKVDSHYLSDVLPLDFYMEAGTHYRMEILFNEEPRLHSYYLFSTYPHNAPYVLTLGNTTFYQGTVTDTDQWEGPVSRAVGLIRYQTGTVNLSVNGRTMTRRITRNALTCDGLACKEAEFILDNPGSGAMTFQLSANCVTNSNMKVYDYGLYALK